MLLNQATIASFQRLEHRLMDRGIPLTFHDITSEDDTFVRADVFHIDLQKKLINGDSDIKIRQNDLFLNANTLQYDLSEEQLNLKENVRVNKGLLRIKSHKAIAKMPDFVRTIGNSSFTYKDFNGKSQNSEYDINAATIVLSGDAQIKQGTRLVKGKNIEFDIEEERVRSTGRAKIKFSTE